MPAANDLRAILNAAEQAVASRRPRRRLSGCCGRRSRCRNPVPAPQRRRDRQDPEQPRDRLRDDRQAEGRRGVLSTRVCKSRRPAFRRATRSSPPVARTSRSSARHRTFARAEPRLHHRVESRLLAPSPPRRCRTSAAATALRERRPEPALRRHRRAASSPAPECRADPSSRVHHRRIEPRRSRADDCRRAVVPQRAHRVEPAAAVSQSEPASSPASARRHCRRRHASGSGARARASGARAPHRPRAAPEPGTEDRALVGAHRGLRAGMPQPLDDGCVGVRNSERHAGAGDDVLLHARRVRRRHRGRASVVP